MSHLIHVLEVKNGYTERGVLCPEEQSHLLNEAYIRAGVAWVYKGGQILSPARDTALWRQLECWNSVSPINGRFIHESILTRINLVAGSLSSDGTLPCPKKFDLFSKCEEPVAASSVPGFKELVLFLIKELEGGHE